jgi:Mg-chelatase subunit ChlD
MKGQGIELLMHKLFAPFVMVMICAAAVFGQSGRVQQKPTPTPEADTIRVTTEEIKLNVLAFDEKGGFFKDVTDNDLVITENDVLHQPTSVRRIPANVLVVMDTGGDMRAMKSLDQTRKVATAVVNALRPGDSIAVMDYADKVEMLSEWSADKGVALNAIRHSNFGRRSMFIDALKQAMTFMNRSGIENKHIVLISDGTDSTGRTSEKFDTLQRLLATDISVHVISYTAMEAADIEPRTKAISNTPPPKAMPDEVRDQLPNGVKDKGVKIGPTVNLDRTLIKKLKSRKQDLVDSQAQLEKISEGTNGEFIVPEGLDEMIEKAPLVAQMIDSSYVVTYTPKIAVAESRGVAERNIEVTSRRPGLIVQARRRLLIDHRK